VLVVVGTRPEAIKMAPVAAALRRYAPEVATRVALTGQHTTLVDQVLTAFDLAPHYDLGIMKDGQSLYDVVHAAMDGLRGVVQEFRPNVLLVQGDTTTVFTAALVGFLEDVRVGHVEAGLRSGDKRAPFPEEVLRHMTDVIADYHFAPTEHARDILLRENTPPGRISVTGNTVVDALRGVTGLDRPFTSGTLREIVAEGRRLVLLTAHRRESFGAPLREVLGAVRTLADEFEDVAIVYPVHPNPEVQTPAWELLAGHPRIHLTGPLDYFDLVRALELADLVLTDSGGIQEEAPTFGTHVLVLREVTERPEGITAGVAELVGTDRETILARARVALASEPAERTGNPYGDGRAGERIADIIVSELTGRPRTTTDWSGDAQDS
jgi:UDP-N-acetylglucosamine 2-epimerase (non-hydrolysing)